MRKIVFILLSLSLVLPSLADTYIVDPNGFKDFTSIQAAINSSRNGDTIEVYPGTYAENVFFNGKAVTLTSSDPNNSSVISNTIIKPTTGYSVTFDFGESASSLVTGFTISGQSGIKCYASCPTIRKNVITGCRPAVYGQNNACPTISQNVITSNGGYVFQSNSTGYSIGGAIFACNGLITNNIIAGNIISAAAGGYGTTRNAFAYGAALYQCNGTIINNSIVGNWATASIQGGAGGGGISNAFGGALYQCGGVVRNNIIAYNAASIVYPKDWSGGAIVDGGGIYGQCQSSYNDFWSNVPNNLAGGAIPDIGDKVADPLFAANGYWSVVTGYWSTPSWYLGDYHLYSQAGRWSPSTSSWVSDSNSSLCVDAGDPCTPIGVEPNPNGGRINMGAYGGTEEASKSPSGIIEPVCTKYPAMDFNKDCKVDFKDFALFAESWLECNLDPPSACWE